jgi:hypothetical protein
MKRTLTDAEISWAIDRNPEIYALWQKAIEIAKRPAPPKPVPEVLIKVTGPPALKARDKPSEVFVGDRGAEGVTTFERNPNHVTVLVNHVREVVDGRPVSSTAVLTDWDPIKQFENGLKRD